MKFGDAAFEVLNQVDEPLHYNEITDRAIEKGVLTTSGQTPHATMGARLYTETLKPNSRFRRGDIKGTFTLRIEPPSDIKQQINAIDTQVRKTLRRRMLKIDPRKFESLVQSLLDEMGLEETSITTYSGDGGIDVRGILNAEDLSQINIAVQAKRWKGNVGPKVIRELRGSLMVHEHGIIITPSDFTASAKSESDEPGKTHISLINGEQLVDLLIHHQVGVINEEYTIPVLDDEYWSEILGEDFTKPDNQSKLKHVAEKHSQKVNFPLSLNAEYKGEEFKAKLLGLEGKVSYAGQTYDSPSGAAKAVAEEWKSVNGWAFWKFQNPDTREWHEIGELRNLFLN